MSNNKEKNEQNIVDKEVFDTFFRENYCQVEYSSVSSDFEEAVDGGLEWLFADGTDFSKVTEENFIIYLRSAAYGEFESIVEDAFDTINPEIMDAVMDVSMTSENEDEITAVYWNTCDDLLKKFLKELYKTKISKLVEEKKR